MHIKSLTHIATRSIPTLSNLPLSIARRSFVPTPSVAARSVGFLYPLGSLNAPENDPIPPITFGVRVDLTNGLIPSTKLFPASISTPASL